MSDAYSPKNDDDIESALIEADLFLKYNAPQRALERLGQAVLHFPRAIALREKLREVAATNKQPQEAARQCLALARLYIESENLETARERLLQAKEFDARISIASGLEAIRRARHTESQPSAPRVAEVRSATLAGDLSAISIFDVVQVVENARLTGILSISRERGQGRIFFNEGRIVDAESEGAKAGEAFRRIVDITGGAFDFEPAARLFPVTIHAPSNTNLILETLRLLDEGKK